MRKYSTYPFEERYLHMSWIISIKNYPLIPRHISNYITTILPKTVLILMQQPIYACIRQDNINLFSLILFLWYLIKSS